MAEFPASGALHKDVVDAFMPIDSDGDVQAAIDEAIEGVGEGLSEEDVQALIDTSVEAELPTRTAGDDDGAVALRFGATATEGCEFRVVDIVVQTNAAAAADFEVVTLPAGSIIICTQMNLQDTIPATTAVKVGLTVTGGEDLIGLTPDLVKNSKSNYMSWQSAIGAEFPLDTEAPILLIAADTDGAPAGTIGGGDPTNARVRVRIMYAIPVDLDDAP